MSIVHTDKRDDEVQKVNSSSWKMAELRSDPARYVEHRLPLPVASEREKNQGQERFSD